MQAPVTALTGAKSMAPVREAAAGCSVISGDRLARLSWLLNVAVRVLEAVSVGVGRNLVRSRSVCHVLLSERNQRRVRPLRCSPLVRPVMLIGPQRRGAEQSHHLCPSPPGDGHLRTRLGVDRSCLYPATDIGLRVRRGGPARLLALPICTPHGAATDTAASPRCSLMHPLFPGIDEAAPSVVLFHTVSVGGCGR